MFYSEEDIPGRVETGREDVGSGGQAVALDEQTAGEPADGALRHPRLPHRRTVASSSSADAR